MMYLNRHLCDVLEEMRACYKTRNFASLLGLIEEAQSMGNKMEAGLADIKDYKGWQKEFTKLKKDLKAARKEQKAIKDAE